jgi:hypothetical protein
MSDPALLAGSSLVSLMAPVGPVAEAFVWDETLISTIMGPYGSAKTTSCIRKAIVATLRQNPGHDGVRRSRGCVVRDTYQQLETNVLKSWFTWFPKDDHPDWNGREMRHTVRFAVNMLDGSEPIRIEMEVFFRAMGDNKAEDVLKGLELTWLWLNEVDTLDEAVIRFGLPRCGRFPSAKDGGCAWYGVWADMNAPDEDNWTYPLLVEKKLPIDDAAADRLRAQVGARFGIAFHRQPGGRDPAAENKTNLPDGYYELMIIPMSENEIRRFVDNEFGAVRRGQPVYPEFNQAVHVSDVELRADPELAILGGLDGGRTPALIFGQHDPATDQLRVLREVVLYDPQKRTELRRLGAQSFGEICAARFAEWFPEFEPGVLFYDPALDYGTEDDGIDFLADFQEAFPWQRVSPGGEPGNRIDPRLEATRRRLTKLPGGKPALQLNADPHVRVLRLAFKSGYVLERVAEKNGRSGRFRSIPEKNDFSHVADAAAELCLGIQNRGRMIANLRELRARQRRGRRGAGSGGNVDYGAGYFKPAATGGG